MGSVKKSKISLRINWEQRVTQKLIARCHRIGSCKTKPGQDRDQPRTVLCRLNRFKDKHRILNNAKKALKNTGIFIYEDFLKDTKELRKSVWDQVLEYQKQNKFPCLNYRSIIARDRNGVFNFLSVTLSFKKYN